MMIAVGAFLVVNGLLDLNLWGKTRNLMDLVIAAMGIALGVWTLVNI